MCGIIGLFNIQNEEEMRQEALKMVRKIRHRGPDWSGSYSDKNCVLMHERLSIVDVEHGAQPLYDAKNKLLDKLELCEIENHIPHQLFRLIWAAIRLDILVDFTQGQHLE